MSWKVYTPSEDSILLAECIMRYTGRKALEIGVGSGIVTRALASRFDKVAGSDINYDALKECMANGGEFDLVCCDAASAFNVDFDFIVTNPPYLPGDPKADQAVYGGDSGVDTTIHIIESASQHLVRGGKMLVVVSSLADTAKLDRAIEKMRMARKVIKNKKLFYETLSVYEIGKKE